MLSLCISLFFSNLLSGLSYKKFFLVWGMMVLNTSQRIQFAIYNTPTY